MFDWGYFPRTVAAFPGVLGNEHASGTQIIERLGGEHVRSGKPIVFDTLYGHHRDVPGYAAALEHFDSRLPELSARLKSGDLAIVTADHGCDPTWQGTDHTRECVPVLAFGPDMEPGTIGRRASFADIGETVAGHLAVKPLSHGHSWLS